jgi:hypothetical protein
MPRIPTYKELVARSDKNLWFDLSNLSEVVDFLNGLPNPDLVGDTAMIEFVHSLGYSLGWAIVHPDDETWVWVPTARGDATIDNRES